MQPHGPPPPGAAPWAMFMPGMPGGPPPMGIPYPPGFPVMMHMPVPQQAQYRANFRQQQFGARPPPQRGGNNAGFGGGREGNYRHDSRKRGRDDMHGGRGAGNNSFGGSRGEQQGFDNGRGRGRGSGFGGPGARGPGRGDNGSEWITPSMCGNPWARLEQLLGLPSEIVPIQLKQQQHFVRPSGCSKPSTTGAAVASFLASAQSDGTDGHQQPSDADDNAATGDDAGASGNGCIAGAGDDGAAETNDGEDSHDDNGRDDEAERDSDGTDEGPG